MNNKRMKNKDAINVLENNDFGVISVVEGNQPYSFPVCYDTDCYCGCLKVFVKAKRCSDLVKIINNNNKVSLIVTNRGNNNSWFGCCNNNGNVAVVATGFAKVEEFENDCCNPKKECFVNIVIEVDCIMGRRNFEC